MSVLIKGVSKLELMKALVQSTYFLPDDIEIIEVPTPHGKLIDADAFKKENERLLHCDFPYLSEATLEELIDEAPTVIEAEE